MKINYDKKATEICINDLTIGKTFFSISQRGGIDEIGLYMIIDRNSGFFLERQKGRFIAVNLSTGYMRAFMASEKVVPVEVEAEVILSK